MLLLCFVLTGLTFCSLDLDAVLGLEAQIADLTVARDEVLSLVLGSELVFAVPLVPIERVTLETVDRCT